MALERTKTADIKKIQRLLNVDNNLNLNIDVNIDIQDAVQTKLCQILKCKAGLPVEEFKYYSLDNDQFSGNKFSDYDVLWSLYDYISTEKTRIDYCPFYLQAETDILYNNFFSLEIAYWIPFLFTYDVIDADGRCTYKLDTLEDEIANIRIDNGDVFSINQEFIAENRQIANFARELDFCFSQMSGPITQQASIYLADLFMLFDGLLTKDELREYHGFFYTIYENALDRNMELLSSKDVAKYYTYQHLIPDSDPRKEIAQKAVEIFVNPMCNLNPNESEYIYADSFVIKHPDRVIIAYKFEIYDYYASIDIEKFFIHPFYYETLQIIDNLLPILEQEYARKESKAVI